MTHYGVLVFDGSDTCMGHDTRIRIAMYLVYI
jgi:hypothetical protein